MSKQRENTNWESIVDFIQHDPSSGDRLHVIGQPVLNEDKSISIELWNAQELTTWKLTLKLEEI